LVAVILYLICASFVVFKAEKVNPIKVQIVGSEEVLTLSNSAKNVFTMSNSSDKKPSNTNEPASTTPADNSNDKIIVDPSKVIKKEPKMILESFNHADSSKLKNEKGENSGKSSSEGKE